MDKLSRRKFLTTVSALTIVIAAPLDAVGWIRGGPPPDIDIFLFWLSDGNALDPTFEPNIIGSSPVLGDSHTLRIYTDAGLTTLYSSANKILDASALSAGSYALASITTLLSGGSYWAQFELVRAGVSYLSNVVSRTML